MTLIPYGPDRLDELTLRVLDIAAQLRQMGLVCREHDLASFDVHDKKAQEWLQKLEQWTLKSSQDLQRQVMRKRGARAAQQFAASLAERRSASTSAEKETLPAT